MLTLAALYIGLVVAPPACPGSYAVAARTMGPLTLGEQVSAVKGHYHTTAIAFNDRMGKSVVYTVTLCGDTVLNGVTDGKHATLYRLGTASPLFRTAKGAHVGMTIAELRQIYPDGRLHVFIGRGVEANFDTGTGVVFALDAAAVPHRCYDHEIDCSLDLQSFETVEVFIQAS